MRRRAISLLELLCVLAILVTLAALLAPVYRRATLSAKATASIQNLKQIHFALTMYRQEHDGEGAIGPAALMGLPVWEDLQQRGVSIVGKSTSIWQSPCGTHPDAPHLQGPDLVPSNLGYYPEHGSVTSWTLDLDKLGDQAVLVDDFNCNDPSTRLGSDFMSKRGVALRLSGAVTTKVSNKQYTNHFWYD